MTSNSRTVIILHGIGMPQRQLESGEDVFWLSEGRFLDTLDRIATLGPTAPRITFDDGNVSDIEYALPALDARGLRATFFLLTGRLGRPGSLSEADVVTLSRAGHRIGLHGHDHVDWRRLDTAGRQREFVWSRERLIALSGQPVNEAAAPFGLYDRQVIRELRTLGFAALHTSDRGRAEADNFLQPRNCLEGSMSDPALNDALLGRLRPLRAMRRVVGVARKRLLPLKVRR